MTGDICEKRILDFEGTVNDLQNAIGISSVLTVIQAPMIPRNNVTIGTTAPVAGIRMEVWRKVRVRGRFCYRKFQSQILILPRAVAKKSVQVFHKSTTTYSNF